MDAFWEIVASNSLLVAVLAVGVALLGRIWKNPVGLHLLWVLVLLKLLAPPVLTVPISRQVLEPAVASEVPESSRGITHASPVETPGQAADSAKVARSPIPGIQVPATVAEPLRIPWLLVLAWTWAAGSILFAARQAYRILRFRRLLREAEVPSSRLLDMAEEIGKRLGLSRTPEIRMLPVRLSPLVWSLGGRPRVYLPSALFERLDQPAQEAILAHELAHVRRKDPWVRLLELVLTTLFWWHPVVWWACRELQELEDQCCDGLVVGLTPHGARTYATALLDTLDFLSERPVAIPLGATAAKSSVLLARRIQMLKTPAPIMRLTPARLALLALIAALPMAVAFAAETTKTDERSSPDVPKSSEPPAIQRRAINKRVKDFPEATNLSTPESALAAYHRALAHMDAQAVIELGWQRFGPRDLQEMERFWKRDPKDIAIYRDAFENAEVLEVLVYREDLAAVISKLSYPEGFDRFLYTMRCFGRINGVWKNLGEDRMPNLQAAREGFESATDRVWRKFVTLRDDVKSGRTTSTEPAIGGPSAPSDPAAISLEKAELMGRVEWVALQGARDVTARKSIEWGDVQKDEHGNRSIRYKYYATIWGRDVFIMNQVFTFDAQGNFLRMEHVEGFPQKKAADPSTETGMKELVEDFFSQNYRDITARETIEWGDLTKEENGNVSIRYKYRARIWNKATKINNEVFTFDPKGKFVSVKKIEQPVNTSTQEGLQELVEDFFCKNFRDITSREVIEWGDVTKANNGNVSIRHKYRAKIWDKETKIMNQVFTFDPKGKFVSVKDVEGFPQNP